MSKLSDIPIVVESGRKYTTTQGVVAIKDGVKALDGEHQRLPKPEWLRIVNQTTPQYAHVKAQVKEHRLATVCEEAKCPNGNHYAHGRCLY